ncbi:MAG: hypothetical protein GY822_11670 [Deltaproteobacteria bacterium]|nr:hypothetical protein [Deltaproteobacteria bacterium]
MNRSRFVEIGNRQAHFAKWGLSLVVMAFTLLSACGSDGEKKKAQGDISLRLRRITVHKAALDKLELDVVLLVKNGQNADLAISGGEISASFVARVEDEVVESDEPSDESGDKRTGDEGTGDEGSGVEEGSEETSGEEDATEAAPAEPVPTLADDEVLDGSWHNASVENATAVAYNDTEVTVRVTVPFPTESEKLDAFLQWGEVQVSVKGDVKLASGTETFSGSRVVGLPSWPAVSVGNVQVSSEMGGKAGEIYITMKLDNENPFDIRVNKYDWNCTIGGKEMRSFTGSGGALAPAASTLAEEDTFKLNQESYGPEVVKLLQQPMVPYRIQAFYEVNGVKKEFVFAGEMSFAR